MGLNIFGTNALHGGDSSGGRCDRNASRLAAFGGFAANVLGEGIRTTGNSMASREILRIFEMRPSNLQLESNLQIVTETAPDKDSSRVVTQ